MSFGLHKPGQGYWVRVMTAAMIAVITLATAGWLMGQMAVVADKLPVSAWSAEIQNPSPEPAPGQRVKLLTAESATTPAELLGTAEVVEYNSGSRTVRIGSFTPAKDGLEAAAASTLAKADDGSGFTASIRGSLNKVPMVQPIILQGVAAALVLLIGAGLAYYFSGVKPGSVEFLISTDMEMKKVNWSTKKDIKNSTLVVVAAAFLLAGVLFTIDVGFQAFFKLINVLQ